MSAHLSCTFIITAEQGNVEYKLQLLNPSPARFTRLVTQLKWRLLEGGGQAYYELGVADSGALVGLPRAQLEQTLETLECMAGEIGASVIVVKEIEVPKEIAGIAAEQTDGWNRKRFNIKAPILPDDPGGETTGTVSTTTDSESPAIFAIDPLDMDDIPIANLEISAVFKPRPFRTRIPVTSPLSASDRKRNLKDKKREKLSNLPLDSNGQQIKRQGRRELRDRKREDKQQALLAYANQGVVERKLEEGLVHKLESLHVHIQPPTSKPPTPPPPDDEEDDVFPLVSPTKERPQEDGRRLIVEALVVRKLSLEEAYLDFGGAFEVL